MWNWSSECPGDELLGGLITGRLAHQWAAPIIAHVDRCERCRARLAEDHVDSLGPGVKLGRYTLAEPLGVGGTGVVYAAYDKQLGRRLAIKLIARMSENAQRSLLKEAQALARLSHRNVVAIYDIGAFAGRVFLAMELLQGQTLRRWWQRTQPGWRVALEALIQAGRGLSAAHEAGLIHRDVKPDNVMRCDDGRVCVTDFGLASRLDAGGNLRRTVGTPAYAAPEVLQGGAPDARSDQFSFCVSAYELLWGHRPFADSPPGNDSGDPERVVRRAARGGPRLPRRVRAALQKGLSRDPSARHASMSELLDILASEVRPTARWWITTGALASIIAGAALPSFGARDGQLCTSAEAALGEAFSPARRARLLTALGGPDGEGRGAAGRVEAVLDAYGRAWIAMHRAACEATRLRGEQSDEVLALRMSCLDRRRAELDALTETLASPGTGGDQRRAQALVAAHNLTPLQGCADVEALRAPVKPPDRPELTEKLRALRERLDRAQALVHASQQALALELASGVAEETRALPYRPLEAEARLLIGLINERQGRFQDAYAVLHEALNAAQAGGHQRVVAEAGAWLTFVAMRLEAPVDGLRWARFTEAALERTGPAPLTQALLHVATAGLLFRDPARAAEATAHMRTALALRTQALGPDHPSVAAAYNNLAAAQLLLHQSADAHSNATLSLGIYVRSLGEQHPSTSLARTTLAEALLQLGRHREAERALTMAASSLAGQLGADHPLRASTLEVLGSARLDLGEAEGARLVLQESLEIRRRAFGVHHRLVADLELALGQAALLGGEVAEALSWIERARATYDRAELRDDLTSARTLRALGQARTLGGDPKQGLSSLLAARRMSEEIAGLGPVDRAEVLESLGAWHLRAGNLRQAETLAQQALSLKEQVLSSPHPQLIRPLLILGFSSRQLGDDDLAAQSLGRAADITQVNALTEAASASLARGLTRPSRR